jgi:serine/threonine-protein kinase
MLTGQPPFVRESALEILAAHVYEPVVPLRTLRPEVPADLEAVVLRCLAKQPDRRFASAEVLEQALGVCACADRWNRQRAADWWRAQDDSAVTIEADAELAGVRLV